MTSKKRWGQIYKHDNPFRLPQNLIKALKEKAQHFQPHSNLKYLWIYVSHDSLENPQELPRKLTTEEWLCVVDEAASLGVQNIVVSIGDPLRNHPEIGEICQWAQQMHLMQVGLHFYCDNLTPEDLALLAPLNKEKTCIFIDDHLRQHKDEFIKLGFRVLPSIGQDQDHVSPECHLPKEMTCLGASGTLYTCGLVLGDEKYKLGNFFEQSIETIMDNPNLPHTIPEGLPKSKHRCNGCPPLMVQRMQQDKQES